MARTQVQSELIATNSISGTIIADGAITSTHLAANSVDTAELVTGSIDTIHIAANQVTSAKIASNSILTRHIQNDQVGGDQLTNNIDIAGTLDVTGATTLDSTLGVAGIATITNAADTDGLLVTSPASSGGTGIQLKRLDSNTDQQVGRILFGNNTDTDLVSVSAKTDGANDNGALMFSTQPDSGALTERMRIDHNGKVGMGATSPSKNLHIKSGVSEDTGIIIENTNNAQNLDIDYWNNAGAVQGRIRYAEGSGAFSFSPNTSATEALTILYDGKVGIGTSSPATTLHVLQDSAKIQIESNGSDTGVQLVLDGTKTSNGAVGDIVFENAHDTVAMIRAERVGGNNDAADMSFYTQVTGGNNAEKMRIDSSGHVLVGKTSGTSGNKVETDGRVSAGAGSNSQPTFNCEGDTNTGINLPETDRIQLITGGTERVRIAADGKVGLGETDPNEPLTIRSSAENVDTVLIEIGNDLHASNTKDAWIKYVGGAAQTDHSWATGILSNTFSIKQVGTRATTPSNGADRLKLDATGCMQLHSNGSGDTTIKLYEGSTIKWWIQNDTGGSPGSDSFWIGDEENDNGVYVGQDGSSWSGISDERLKRNWTNLENATDKIKTLTKVGTFQRRGKTTGKWSDNREVGLSAQEVQAILPEAVTTGGDIEFASDDKVTGVKGLSYDKLVPLLVKSIQELEARIKTLES